MSPSKTPRKVEGSNGLWQKPSVSQAKIDQSLEFHGLGQPGAAMGLVQSQAKPKSWLAKVPVGAENIKFGSKWVENRRFGPKQRPNES